MSQLLQHEIVADNQFDWLQVPRQGLVQAVRLVSTQQESNPNVYDIGPSSLMCTKPQWSEHKLAGPFCEVTTMSPRSVKNLMPIHFADSPKDLFSGIAIIVLPDLDIQVHTFKASCVMPDPTQRMHGSSQYTNMQQRTACSRSSPRDCLCSHQDRNSVLSAQTRAFNLCTVGARALRSM